MKVILFDPMTSGHHIKYATYIIRYLIEQGDEVTFVTWQKDESLLQLLTPDKSLVIKYVVKDSKERISENALKHFKQLIRGLRYCFNLATKQQASIVHHLYLDRSELPLLFSTLGKYQPWKLFTTLFWSYFIYQSTEKVTLLKRLYHNANRQALGHLLKQGKLNNLFVHTTGIKEMLVSSYGNCTFNQRIIVVPDPIESMEKVSQKMARDQLGLPQKKPLLLFFGMLRWDKGPDIFLDSLLLLHGDWYAVMAGEPAKIGEAEIKQYHEKLREPMRLFTRLEHIPERDVAKYFAAADAVMLPYRKIFKGTSGILQHGTAAGKPIISSDVGEIGSIVKENGLGIVVKPESPASLAKGIQDFLIRREEITKEVRSRGFQYAKANDWRIMAKRVRESYLSAI